MVKSDRHTQVWTTDINGQPTSDESFTLTKPGVRPSKDQSQQTKEIRQKQTTDFDNNLWGPDPPDGSEYSIHEKGSAPDSAPTITHTHTHTCTQLDANTNWTFDGRTPSRKDRM